MTGRGKSIGKKNPRESTPLATIFLTRTGSSNYKRNEFVS